MERLFLFRLDGATENHDFFLRRREQGASVAYAGTTMSIGPGWIPDLVEVEMKEDANVLITLIELEAAEITARASCRKYLPESSSEVVARFIVYLETVIRQCQATADPRMEQFDSLKGALLGGVKVVVRAAGALRSASDFVELHALLDQPERLVIVSSPMASVERAFGFGSTRSFSREEIDGLRRTVRILHAVVTGHDHSNGTVHSWRNLRRKLLDMAVSKDRDRFNQLHQLLENKWASGMKIDCDRLVNELADLWSSSMAYRMARTDVATVVRDFVPVSMKFSNQESMRAVYEAARSLLGRPLDKTPSS